MKKIILSALTALIGLPLQAQHTVDVAVFSINDFHGAFVRSDHKGIAGAPSVVQTLDSLKRVYPYHLTVSAGDNFGGSYFYNATHGQLLPVLFNDLGIRLSAVGNHEFDDGQRSLAEKWRTSPLRPTGWDLSYVCANVRSNATGRVPEFAQPTALVEVPLPGGRSVKVGFEGLIASSTPQQVSVRRISGLSFDGRYPAVTDSVAATPDGELLRQAHVRLLLTHVGTRMNATTHQPEWDDLDSAQMARFTSAQWDGILSSHSHKLVCGRINDTRIPVVQGRWHGDYISALICRIDTTTMKLVGVEPHTFRVTPKAHLEAGPARLQQQIDSLLQHTTTEGGTPLGTLLTQARADMPHDRDNKWRQSQVGTLVCRAYAEEFRRTKHLSDKVPVMGCSHFGSIRAGFVKGPVSVLDVGEALPFANVLKVFRLTGEQLQELVEFGLHNQRFGWIQLGNMEVEQDADTHVTGLTYVSPQGKRIRLQPKKKYYLVADDFMTHGGDGYSSDFFPADQGVKADGMHTTTDAFINYLREQKEI